ncbi:hypothetical protein B0O80DRAFT_527598 [Mortierella sp. GBAus27b]|nr:hypothetical protein BGX31_006923 [Mortierella sp. GBA43]KAI8356860.1 hypothetical protein B0O80DRAFT_527598 [Mortierella sp. GBAus27b]
MQRIAGRYTTPLRTGFRHLQQHTDKNHYTRSISVSICSYQDEPKVDKADGVSGDSQDQQPNLTASKDGGATGSISRPPRTDDLVKKFKLKPSAEVGIRARMKERQRVIAEDSARRARMESMDDTDRIQKLFDRLQLGKDEPRTKTETTGLTGPGSASPKNISESWKFLFDEDDLDEESARRSSTGNQSKEILDSVPGASNIFPKLSDYRSPSSVSSTTMESSSGTDSEHQSPRIERWKDPRMKSTERDAFKALFSSLFEHKKPEEEENWSREEEQGEEQKETREQKLQSIFSNFSRTGQDIKSSGTQSSTTQLDSLSSVPGATSIGSSSESPVVSDPAQVLQRQLENLSKRVDPIYLARKPNTPSFEVMKNTVGPHDWMGRDPTLPQDNSLFNALRDETQVAIRMRRELTDKQQDIVKVREFVDNLIAPFAQPSSRLNGPRPSSVGLDGLLAQAILATSSTRLDNTGAEFGGNNQSERSLHPFMGHAMVEQTRKQGLPVFIRVVRTESYKALIKSRWDAWRDGPGCLEILKEMRRNGALVDGETKNLARIMRRQLAAVSPPPTLMIKDEASSKERLQQYGWGEEEQAAPILEMLDVIKMSHEEDDYQHIMKQVAKRSEPRP